MLTAPDLPRLPAPALVVLSTALPLLLSPGGDLRLWRKLGAAVQHEVRNELQQGLAAQHQGTTLQPDQLCEVLPLVLQADLAVPVTWVAQALDKIQGCLPSLSLTQTSRALAAAVALDCPPPKPWLDAYMLRFRSQLSELNPEGLVDVLRALSKAGALPSYDWLVAMEQDVERRFGFIGPVELSSTAFLFANLGHNPSDFWKSRFLSEALRFRAYYTGPDLAQVVWSAVRLGTTPDSAWLEGFVDQLADQLRCLQAYQLTFTFAALQKMGADMPSQFIDRALEAYRGLLPEAAPSDTALLLVTVARLQHICTYSWLQAVLDHVQENMLRFDGQELVTLIWSLAKLHHQPCPEWLAIFFEALEPQLPSLYGNQLAEMMWALAQLQISPPADWLDAFLIKAQSCLATDTIGGKDAATILASLAAVNHTPPEPWLHSCLSLIYWRIRELDAEGLAAVAISLAKLKVFLADGAWLDNYVSMTLPKLSAMQPQTQANLLSALAVFGATPNKAWVAAFQLLMVQQAEAGKMTVEQLEQVVVALASLKATPSTALLQLYFDASLPLLDTLASKDPSSIASILKSLQAAQVRPDATWLKAAVAAVRTHLRGFSVVQLNGVAQALASFEAGGMKYVWLSDFTAFLKEFLLY
eukprot:gene2071-2391_t